MCEYCKNLCNSDDVKSVALSKQDIGEFVGREISIILGMHCYEHGETGRYQLYTMFDMEGADLDAVSSINIHYCPMCGRKLD